LHHVQEGQTIVPAHGTVFSKDAPPDHNRRLLVRIAIVWCRAFQLQMTTTMLMMPFFEMNNA